jgi:hypothetical protein
VCRAYEQQRFQSQSSTPSGQLSYTTTDLDITAGLITAGFVRTDSDDLENEKMTGTELKPAVMSTITAGSYKNLTVMSYQCWLYYQTQQ